MKIELVEEMGRCFIIPTMVITYDKTLNGYHEISFTWLGRSLVFTWGIDPNSGESEPNPTKCDINNPKKCDWSKPFQSGYKQCRTCYKVTKD